VGSVIQSDLGIPAGPERDGTRLSQSLYQAAELLAASVVYGVSMARIDLPALPDPPLAADADRAILQAIAPLYFAMEIETAGLTRALSALSELFAAGAFRIAGGPAADLLMEHHRSYEARRPSDDRYATYLRLFGTAPPGAVPFATADAVNTGFDEVMLRLAEAMHRYANLSPLELAPLAAQRDIRGAARQLGENLVMRGGGASHYLADEALALIGTATKVFREPVVQGALGVRGLWEAVETALALAVGRQVTRGSVVTAARAHLERGRAGMTLLQWIADSAADLAGIGRLTIARDAAVLAQGTAWLEATLTLLSVQEAAADAA
jgi:hypothetical protein